LTYSLTPFQFCTCSVFVRSFYSVTYTSRSLAVFISVVVRRVVADCCYVMEMSTFQEGVSPRETVLRGSSVLEGSMPKPMATLAPPSLLRGASTVVPSYVVRPTAHLVGPSEALIDLDEFGLSLPTSTGSFNFMPPTSPSAHFAAPFGSRVASVFSGDLSVLGVVDAASQTEMKTRSTNPFRAGFASGGGGSSILANPSSTGGSSKHIGVKVSKVAPAVRMVTGDDASLGKPGSDGKATTSVQTEDSDHSEGRTPLPPLPRPRRGHRRCLAGVYDYSLVFVLFLVAVNS
jgi:hypothetical protein